jgi:hypothetical protein
MKGLKQVSLAKTAQKAAKHLHASFVNDSPSEECANVASRIMNNCILGSDGALSNLVTHFFRVLKLLLSILSLISLHSALRDSGFPLQD